MKTIITYCFLAGAFISLKAQPNFSKKEILKEFNNTQWVKLKPADQVSATQLATNKTLLKLQTDDELQLLKTSNDVLGYSHYRYQQSYKGIPIEGAIYLMHEKDNKVKQANGKLIHDLNLSTKPTINEAEALQAAIQHINATLYAWEDAAHEQSIKQVKNQTDATFYPKGELVIIDPEFKQQAANHRLAYKFDIYALNPYTRKTVYIDAIDGTILKTLEKIHNCINVSVSGTTNYSGNQNFTACQDGGIYTLKSNIGGGIQVFNSNNTFSNQQIPFINSNNFFEDDPTANEVYWATEKTYEYFLNAYGRNSLDGNGMPLLSWVHAVFTGGDKNNASWNGSWMTYGDGDSTHFNAFTSPDVVAHEMTHGINDFSADLIYSYESGALNESFSDIFGEVAENYMLGSNDWLLGADFIVAPGKTSLRNMSNPNDPNAIYQLPDTYKGDFWYTGFSDNGGIHYNSGVQNFWFYLLCEGGSGTNDKDYEFSINAIGMEKAAAVAYRNLTAYLVPNAQYTDARTGSIAAAEDLQGEGILTVDDVEQIKVAWCAVGVGNCGSTPPPDNEPTPSETCNRLTDSLALVALYNSTNGTNWTNKWDLNQPMDTWYGINLNADGCVMNLILNENNLAGTIPPEIGNLINLTELQLEYNQLIGSLPAELGNLIFLERLFLRANQLSGSLPTELGNLTSLELLRLPFNQLNGSIPIELANLSNLGELTLAYNEFSGSLPAELGNLISLRTLSLHNNEFTGSIPSELGNLTYLIELRLAHNQLIGSIPAELGNLTKLKNLMLQHNQLTGSIPVELSNLTNIIRLWLSFNQLTGGIPTQLGNLTNLTWLWLNNNQLTGSIPIQLSNLTLLRHLYLQFNQLTGIIPAQLGSLTDLTDLSFGGNQLSGSIPPQLGNLTNLITLNFRENHFSGSLPAELCNLTNLTLLEVFDNNLEGCYPDCMNVFCSQLTHQFFNSNQDISTGNNFEASWEDFCLNGSGSCDPIVVNPVWPGDFNNDGIANIHDLLYWGAAEGFTGAIRPNASFNWSAQDCPDWALSVNGINSKHQDGNGNGTIDTIDINALIENYDSTHNYVPLTYFSEALKFHLELVSSIPNGNTNTLTNTYNLYVKSLYDLPVSTHGLACSIDFDDMPIDSVIVDVSNSSLMPDESINKYLKSQNRLDLALTRTDNNNQTLDGSVARFIIVVEDVQVGDPFEIQVSNGSMMSANGNIVAVRNASFYGSFTGGASIISNLSVNVSAAHEGCNMPGSAMVQATGGTVPYSYSWSTATASGNTANNLTSGIYSVTVSDDSGLSTSVFFQINGQTPIYDANGNLLCGSICPDYLEPNGVMPDGQYNANIKLESNTIILEGYDVRYEAGETIQLRTGFEVKSGASFSANIEECD